MKPLGLAEAVRNAFSVAGENVFTVLLLAFIVGGCGDAFSWTAGTEISQALTPVLNLNGPQATQVKAFTTNLMVVFCQIAWYGPVGAWGAAATIYLWVQRYKQKEASLYDAINFGLNRWGRVVGPHTKAYLFIQLGAIIIIGGILLGLRYAYVDAIATLDDKEKDALARSGRLTQTRRGTLFYAFLLCSPWIVFYQIAITFILPEQTLAMQFGAGMVTGLMLVLLDLVMVQFYLDLFQKRDAPAAAASGA